jgi:hypothetical protein
LFLLKAGREDENAKFQAQLPTLPRKIAAKGINVIALYPQRLLMHSAADRVSRLPIAGPERGCIRKRFGSGGDCQ